MSYYATLKTLIEEKIIQDSQFNAESAFCEIVSEYLVDTALISDFQHSLYFEKNESGRNLKINGFCINENETVLSLFIANYNSTDDESKLNLKDVELKFKQLYRVLNYVIKSSECDLPKANVLSALNKEYRAGINDNIIKINLYLFTNNKAVNKKEVDVSKIISSRDTN